MASEYPDDVECPDWCVGQNADEELDVGGHFTDVAGVNLSDRQAVTVRGIRGWYDGEADYIELAVRDPNGRTAALTLDRTEWDAITSMVEPIMYAIT